MGRVNRMTMISIKAKNMIAEFIIVTSSVNYMVRKNKPKRPKRPRHPLGCDGGFSYTVGNARSTHLVSCGMGLL